MAPVTQGQPGQRTVTGGPAIAAADNRADPTTPVRADNVPTRAIAPTAALPPPVPADVAPIPNAAVPLVPPAPSSPPPQVAVAPSITRPPAPAPNQLDEALRRTFPDTAPRQGVDALAATIYFGDGAAGLTEADRAILREVAQLHRERGGNVRVVGYASPDGRGDTATRRLANLDVASRRADGVSRELARFGVPTTAITTSAEGMPASDGVAGAGYGAAGERRVDIYLDY
jgi:outer membrane protein OmpA-like peptidoglycan-associated protein